MTVRLCWRNAWIKEKRLLYQIFLHYGRVDVMDQIKDEQMKKMLSELAEFLHQAYGIRLKAVILYGSVARGTYTNDSDVDIMVLVDGDNVELREYDEMLSDISTDISLKYMKVFSIIDISYQEYQKRKQTLPFYKNVSKEGVCVICRLICIHCADIGWNGQKKIY